MAKKKLTFDVFIKNFTYHSFSESAFLNKKSGKFVHGWKYYLTDKITEEQNVFLEQFKNVKVGKANYVNANDITYDVVFIGNSCFKEV